MEPEQLRPRIWTPPSQGAEQADHGAHGPQALSTVRKSQVHHGGRRQRCGQGVGHRRLGCALCRVLTAASAASPPWAGPNTPSGDAHPVGHRPGAEEALRDNRSALVPVPPTPQVLRTCARVILPLCSSSHPGAPATPGTAGDIPGHTGGLQASSWVGSPGQDVFPELGQNRERLRQPGPPPTARQLWEQEDQGAQELQPSSSAGGKGRPSTQGSWQG